MRSLVFLILFALAAPADAETSTDRFAPWRTLAGCWAGEAVETNNIGETFRQRGRRLIRLDSGALINEESYHVLEATGAYEPALQQGVRRYSERWTFDNATNLLTMSNESQSARVAVAADGRELFRTFLFHHERRNITLAGEVRERLTDDGAIETVDDIRDPFGPYRETYNITWRRLDVAPEGCLFEAD